MADDKPGTAGATAPAPAPAAERSDAQTVFYSKSDGDQESELPPPSAVRAAAPGRRPISASDVKWAAAFADNADYWHLPAAAEGATFELTMAVIDAAIAAGRYLPHVTADGLLIIAIRGAAIVGGAEVVLDASKVALREQKPDHRNFRCVMVVADRAKGEISAFEGSTVPNRGGVASQYNKANGFGGELCNMLPTGCYELCVGTHHGSVTVPTVLRLGTGTGPDTALRVTTLRSIDDGVYEPGDFWDNCKPMDNIHPAFSANSAEFSSLGCLTVPGTFSNGQHKGNWARFRKAGRFDSSAKMGTRYNLVLTTGMELAALATAGSDAAALKALARLSHGSVGDEVKALQKALGINQSGTIDAETKKALATKEQQMLQGKTTGVYSARSEREMKLGVFK